MGKDFQNLVWNYKEQAFGIWYVALLKLYFMWSFSIAKLVKAKFITKFRKQRPKVFQTVLATIPIFLVL